MRSGAEILAHRDRLGADGPDPRRDGSPLVEPGMFAMPARRGHIAAPESV
jgi:hypothetical protein